MMMDYTPMYQSTALQRIVLCTSAMCFDISIFADYAYPVTVEAADRILKYCKKAYVETSSGS